MEDVITMLIPIVAILSCVALPIGFGMYLGLVANKTKHKENMELIKQGIVPPPNQKSTPNKYRSLRNGFLCLGIGIGIIVGIIISKYFIPGYEDQFFILASSVLFFLGLAYTLFYLVTRNKDLDEQ